MAKEPKHHYIPVFYLKQWARSDGRLCEFSRPHNAVKPRMTHPDGTAYVRGLYTFPNLPPKVRNSVENELLQIADDEAALALRRMVAGDMDFGSDTRSAWCRFLMSLMHRTPERIAQIRRMVVEQYPKHMEAARERWHEIKHPNDQRTIDEVLAVGLKDIEHVNILLLQMAMDSKPVGDELINMVWGGIHFHRPAFPLLTSDRPTIMTNGIKHDYSHIVLPICPDRVFVAARNRQIVQELNRIFKRPETPARLNDLIARQARRFVYGTTDRQLRFVENRLGQRIRSSPFD
jgi:hypothetical protein